METNEPTRRTLFHRLLSLGLFSMTPVAVAESISRSRETAILPSYARSQETGHGSRKHGYRSATDLVVNRNTTVEIFNEQGPGAITQLCFDLSSGSPQHLKDCVLRCYWEDSNFPSVEVPIGDFFGLNLGQYAAYESAYLACTPSNVLHSYFAMPYRKGARITVENQSESEDLVVTAHVAFHSVERLPEDSFYFHSRYSQTQSNSLALFVGNRHTCLDTRGRGHLMGITVGVLKTGEGHWHDRKEMIAVDSQRDDSRNADDFERRLLGDIGRRGLTSTVPFTQQTHGIPLVINPTRDRGRFCYYRWYGEAPIAFKTHIRHTINWDQRTQDADVLYSAAYWYQASPSSESISLPHRSLRVI
jgi:hypothetical protein